MMVFNTKSGLHIPSGLTKFMLTFNFLTMRNFLLPVTTGIFLLLLGNPKLLKAQETQLTLSDAVLKAGSELAPDDLRGLQWIPGSHHFSYISLDGRTLMRAGVDFRDDSVLLHLDSLSIATGIKGLSKFPDFTWLDARTAVFAHSGTYYKVSLPGSGAIPLFTLSDGAANPDLHAGTLQLAYTSGCNLRILDEEHGDRALTYFTDAAIVSGQAIARVEFGISKGTFWSPDGSRLAFYQKDERAVSDYPLLDLSQTPAVSKIVKYPMAGQVSEIPAVGVYDMEGESTIYLQAPVEEDSYRTNLAWDPSGNVVYLAELNRAQNHMQLNSYDAVSGKKLGTLFEERSDKWVEPETAPWFVPGRPDEFVWLSERDGFMNLYLYHKSGRLIRQLTKNSWVADQIIGIDHSGRNLIFSGTGPDPRDMHLFRVDLYNGRQEQITAGPGRYSGLLSGDGHNLIVKSSGVTLPGSIRLYDLVNGVYLWTLHESRNPLADYKIGQIEFPVLYADDGTPLYGRLIKPSNFDPSKKYPVLVYVYGGPHLQLVTHNWLGGAPLWMFAQAEKECLVFSLDNRGSAQRGFSFESAIYRQLGSIEIEDQLKGLEYLRNLPFVDSRRMAVYGWSYGGFMAAGLMLKTPGHFGAGVAGGPVTDWKYYEVMYGERYMSKPEENPEGYRTSSLLHETGRLKGDLLLIHGAMDSTVVPQHVFALLDGFIASGIQIDFFLYPGHPHNVRGKDRLHLMQKILGYIDEKLKIAAANMAQ